jgi:hypothetical protein
MCDHNSMAEQGVANAFMRVQSSLVAKGENMSLEKAIRYRKEKRKPYYDSRRFDWTCKNHGSCDYCERRRLYNRRKTDEWSKLMLKEGMEEV